MAEAPRVSSIHGQRTVFVELTEEGIDDVLGDVPGGQSVSETTRHLLQHLHTARRHLREQREESALLVLKGGIPIDDPFMPEA
jgi:hypothetical protein